MMSIRKRILMIRLVEKLEKYPAYAEALGIEVTGAVKNQKGRKTQMASQ